MFNKIVNTLDVTDSDIRVVSFEDDKITKWASAPIPEGLVKGGSILDPGAVAAIIDDLFASLELKRNHVICCLTGLPYIYRTISMPNVNNGLKPETIEREGRRELSVSEEEMYLFWQTAEVHFQEKERDYFILAVPKSQMNALTSTLTQAKISFPIIDIKSLAISRAVDLKDAIIISLEKHYFEIVMVANGLVRVIHNISSEAEIDENMAIVSDIVEGLSQAVKFYNRDYSKNILPLETPIILGGELSANPDILRLLNTHTGHPVKLFKPQFELPPEIHGGKYVSNIGLMLKKKPVQVSDIQYHDISINFVPQLRKPRPFQISWSYTFLTVIALLITFLLYKSYQLMNTEKEYKLTLEQSSANVADQLKSSQSINQLAIDEKKQKLGQLTIASNQLNDIRGSNQMIFRQKLDYSSIVEALIETLPLGVDYSMINIDPSGIMLSGRANASDNIMVLVDKLEKNELYSDVRIDSISPVTIGDKTSYQYQIALGIKLPPGSLK
jgi:hypothetical protein